MTPGYKERRTAKHAAEAVRNAAAKAAKAIPLTIADQFVNLLPRGPRLNWQVVKSRPQGDGGRKNWPGRIQEQARANEENKNPYKVGDLWYWYDETEQACETGYATREAAEVALNEYADWLNNGPKEIGGIREDLGVPGSDACEVSG